MFKAVNVFAFLMFFLLSGCKKDEPVYQKSGQAAEVYSDVALEFKLFANGQSVVDSTYYTNASGDSFSINQFNYYISNIKLTRADGFVYYEKDVYRLVKHQHGSEAFVMKDVPTGKYREIEFLIGVDSLRNVSGIQSGALDPAQGMFWDWNSGYIFFKMEGSFSTSSQQFKDDYAIHIGGFKGPYPCLQTAKLTLDTLLNVRKQFLPTLHFKVDAEEIFKNPHDMGFDKYYSNISDKTFMEVSENYRDMFSIQHIEN